jgi:peptidoglycan/LPS O-acetylase OafA/YrhL
MPTAFGMQFFFGAFLSDLSQHPGHIAWCQARKWTSRVLAPILIFIGLLLASYPEDKAQWMRWSEFMGQMSIWIFPRDNETPRFYSGIGLEFVALGIHFSPSAKNVLSNKYLLWFGKNSFAVYLLHGTLLRTVLVWLYFGTTLPADVTLDDGKVEPGPPIPQPGRARFWFWLPIWLVFLYAVANLWTKYVDPWCARVTEKLVNYVWEDQKVDLNAEKERLLPQ